jgi:hypothetical protein
VRLREQTAPHNVFTATVWGNPRAMTEVLKKIKRELGNEGAESINVDRVKIALTKFVKTQEVENFTQLKYLCHGLLLPAAGNTWCLLDRETLFDKLLAIVTNRQKQAKQFRKCFQGLLGTYFAFDLHAATENTRLQNWLTLRTFLAAHHTKVVAAAQERGTLPEWLNTLTDHNNLLGDSPCQRYSAELAKGDTEQLKAACSGLGITATSWVWIDALMAYVEKVCSLSDRDFNSGMSGVLKLINGRSDLKLPDHLADKATAKVVIRYSACPDKPEQSELRDTCVARIGNPWLNRTAWDAHVSHEPARVMVEGWVKKRLIRDFFELLAHDGMANTRRLNYWLKWEPQVTDMWFVLGYDARRNQSAAFDSVKKRMGSAQRRLSDKNSANNAFIMRIGQLLVVEFGLTGNACFVFAASEFRTDLNQVTLDTDRDLKQKNRRARLLHQGSWELGFDADLRGLLRLVPTSLGVLAHTKISEVKGVPKVAQVTQGNSSNHPVSAPSIGKSIPQFLSGHNVFEPVAAKLSLSATSGGPLQDSDFEFIKAQCDVKGIEWEDNRHKRGAFWVMVQDRAASKTFTDTLERIGFNFAPSSKGFWYKPK